MSNSEDFYQKAMTISNFENPVEFFKKTDDPTRVKYLLNIFKAADMNNIDAMDIIDTICLFDYWYNFDDYLEELYNYNSEKGYILYLQGYIYSIHSYKDKPERTSMPFHMASVEKSNRAAMNLIGQMYETGWRPLEIDYKLAMKYYTMSAEKGNKFAYINIGRMYEYGDGVDKNLKIAIKYYIMANSDESIIKEAADHRPYLFGHDRNYMRNIINELMSLAIETQKELVDTQRELKVANQKKDEFENKYTELFYRPLNPGYDMAKNEFMNS